MFDQTKEVFFREIKYMKKDRRGTLLLFVISIFYMSLFGWLFSENAVKNIPTVVADLSGGSISRTLAYGFESAERFDVQQYAASAEEAEDMIKDGRAEIAVIIPADFDRKIKRGEQASVIVGADSANIITGNSTAAYAYQVVGTVSAGVGIKRFQATGMQYEYAYSTAVPVSVKYRPWFNPAFGFKNYILLGILAVAIQQITIMYTANSFARETRLGTEKKLYESYRPGAVYAGKTVHLILAGLVNLTAGLLVVRYGFGVRIEPEVVGVYALAVPFIISMISWGYLISLICKKESEATQLVMLITYPVFLTTGFVWPLHLMPELYGVLSKLLPLSYFSLALRRKALMGDFAPSAVTDFFVLLLLAAVYTGIGYLAVKARSRKIKGASA